MTPDEGRYMQVKTRVKDSLNALPKPKLRGWIHTVTAPLSLAASIVLICLADTTGKRWACAVYLVCSLLLFGVSALYHRIDWGERALNVMRRFDHCNIFLFDCGILYSDSSFVTTLFAGQKSFAAGMAGSLGGHLAVYILAEGSPLVVRTDLYFAGLGGTGLYGASTPSRGISAYLATSGGGLCYSIGAVFYGIRWPGRRARYFGYHEIFHAGTVAGWTCICIAAYFAVLS